MPKKTREEKILARLHRLEKTQTEGSTPTPDGTVSKSTFNLADAARKETVSSPAAPTTGRQNLDYSYVKGDLRKIALFTIAALLTEFVLSLTFAKHLQNLFF